MSEQSHAAFERVEGCARVYASARDDLRRALAALQAGLRQVSEQHRPDVLAALDAAVNSRAALVEVIRENPELFKKPKTQQIQGIKVGFRKQPGKLEFDDEAKVIERIREKLRSKAATLIQKTESLVASAVKTLPANDLAAIGCKITDVDDEVVADAVESELDKIMKAITSKETFTPDMVEKGKLL